MKTLTTFILYVACFFAFVWLPYEIAFSKKTNPESFVIRYINTLPDTTYFLADRFCLDQFDSVSFNSFIEEYYFGYKSARINVLNNLCLLMLVKKEEIIFNKREHYSAYTVVE